LQSQGGSLSDFEELVHRYEDRIYRFAFTLCRNEIDARELTQETFVTAFLKLRRFDPGQSFAAWLFTLARRKCIDRHRAMERTSPVPLPEQYDGKDPSVILSQQEAEQDIWQLARRALPEAQFQALWLKYGEEMNVRQVARVMGKTQIHVKVLLFRARTVLAKALEESRIRTGQVRPEAMSPRANLRFGKTTRSVSAGFGGANAAPRL